jgi:hypothetical protein
MNKGLHGLESAFHATGVTRGSIDSLPYACRVFCADSLAKEMDARLKPAHDNA